MPIYWGDYLKHTMHLSTEEHGAYLLLICHYWQNGGKIQNNEKIIKNVCKISSKKLQNVLAFFEEKEGFLIHTRIDIELVNAVEHKEKQKIRTEAARKAKATKEAATDIVTGIVTGSPSPSPSPSPSSESKDSSEEREPLAPRIDYKLFVDMWNKELSPKHPAVRGINDKRKQLIKARLFENLNQDFAEWGLVLEKIKQSSFLGGDNDRGFIATFDWVTTSSNMIKILEGNYDNRGNTNGNQNGTAYFNGFGQHQSKPTKHQRLREAADRGLAEWEAELAAQQGGQGIIESDD
jgi:uncharacterized protein YdaU (DUF1376 family)